MHGSPVEAGVSLLVAVLYGVGATDQLKAAGHILNVDQAVSTIFNMRRHFSVDLQFDAYRANSRGCADFENGSCQPVRRTITSFIVRSNFFDRSTGLVKELDYDQDQISNLISEFVKLC